MSDKPSDVEIQEMLAFELYAFMAEEARGKSRADLAQTWRETPSLRTSWRTVAEKFIAKLENSGLTVKLKRSNLLRGALKELITIPEQPAYVIGND